MIWFVGFPTALYFAVRTEYRHIVFRTSCVEPRTSPERARINICP